MSALKFIQLVARKKAAEQGGKGITTIGNRMNAEAKAGEIAETFRLSGLTPDKWDDFIKSEKDVLKYLNIFEATNKQALKQETSARFLSGLGKPLKEGQVIQFPKDKITDWTKPRPTTGKKADVTELDDPLVNEFARTETLASPTRIKQGFSTQSKLNSWSQNQQWVKDFIGRKNREFNSLNKADQKEVLEMFETQIKKHMPKEPKAYGGLAGMLGERTGYKDAKKVKGRDEEIFYPPYETNDPEEAIKEIIKRLINVEPAKVPLTDKLQLMFDLNRIKAGGSTDLFGGELNFGYNKGFGRDDESYGFEWKKQFAGGGLAPLLGEPTYTDENHRVPYNGGGSISDVLPADFDELEPEHMDLILKLLKAGEIPQYAGGGRVPLKDGTKFDPTKRTFLKGIATLASIPIVGKFFKWAKPLAKVKPSDDVVMRLRTFIDDSDDADGVARAKWGGVFDIEGLSKPAQRTLFGIMKDIRSTRRYPEKTMEKIRDGSKKHLPKSVQYYDDISPEDAPYILEQLQKAGHKVKYEHIDDVGGSGVDDVLSSFKNDPIYKGTKEGAEKYKNFKEKTDKWSPRKKDEYHTSITDDWGRHHNPDVEDFYDIYYGVTKKAEGGRVPFSKGKRVLEGLAKLMDEFFPGTTKLGKTSRPMAPKTELKRSIAGFQERQNITKEPMRYRGPDEFDTRKQYEEYLDSVLGPPDEVFGSPMKDDFLKEWDKVKAKNVTNVTPEEELRQEFPGITDNLVNKILADDNPQRIAEVKATIHEALKMQEKGMGPEEIINIFKNMKRTKNASGGRVPLSGGLLAKLGKFSKAQVLEQMFKNTIKQTKSANTKKRFTNFLKEIQGNPELANDPQVWNFFTGKLPKNQRLVVHSDDSVDFWRQSDFGPHNIETTNKFMQKHPNLSRDEAVRIQNMEPEDQILEMKRLETIADRSRTKNASGGRVSLSSGGVAGMLGE